MAVGAVLLHLIEEPVDEVDQLHPERLEGVVPLAVPVGVRHDGDGHGTADTIGSGVRVERPRAHGGIRRRTHEAMGPYSAS